LVTVVESSADAIVGKSLDGIVSSWNPGAERLFGYTASEMIGQSIALIYPPERRGEMKELHDRLRHGERVPDHDTVRLAKSGKRIDVSIGMWPIFDADGLPVGVASISRDITERRRIEAEQRFLAEASAVLASSLDYEATLARVASLAVPDLADWCTVYLQQEDGSISRLAIAHADPAQAVIATEIQEQFHVDPRAPVGIPRVLRTGRSELHVEASPALIAADADRPAEQEAILSALPIHSWMIIPLTARERTLGAVSLITAESARRFGPTELALAEDLARRAALAIDNARLYQEAQDAILLRDRFLSIAAHELRNPVTVLKGAADLLRRRRPDSPSAEERQQRLLQQIGKAADRLVELTNDLLDVSRIRLGQLPLRLERVDLSELVRELGTHYQEQVASERRLAVVTPADPCVIKADAGRLEQVLLNLLDNAVKYSPDGGAIEIALCPHENGALIQVRDQGIGLPPESVESIFEPFGRAGNTAAFQGMGLGLAISRSIVERHGGRIWAESAGEGCGTTFSLWLPAESATERAAAISLLTNAD
jgi:PAS domain S-box-containing protein